MIVTCEKYQLTYRWQSGPMQMQLQLVSVPLLPLLRCGSRVVIARGSSTCHAGTEARPTCQASSSNCKRRNTVRRRCFVAHSVFALCDLGLSSIPEIIMRVCFFLHVQTSSRSPSNPRIAEGASDPPSTHPCDTPLPTCKAANRQTKPANQQMQFEPRCRPLDQCDESRYVGRHERNVYQRSCLFTHGSQDHDVASHPSKRHINSPYRN
jgi:hypothetical protein